MRKKIIVILVGFLFISTNLPTISGKNNFEFHSYIEMTNELQNIANNYSNIAKLYELGNSVLDRTIWGLKITDNPDLEENEPEVRICGCHHGNEIMSVELPLLLAWHLVENYSINPEIKDLIDNREIWIIPLVNPDGRMATPVPTRRNANRVDLNRDYGYMWDGSGGSPSPFSQPETQAIRNHALENNFVLSLSFHTTAAYINYLWNYKPQLTPDDDLIVLLSNQYENTSGYTAINGYEWYQVRGDLNDFSYGCRGDIDWTIETENTDIDRTWDKNRDAIIDIIDAADIGLSGIVTDAITDQPIEATIWVEEVYWPCFTDPKIGDYHRILLPGVYTVHFRANGYEEQVHIIEVIDSDKPSVLDVSLDRQNNFYAHQITWCNFYDPYNYPDNFENNPTEAISALGPPDNIFASLGVGGEIVLDMGKSGEGEIFNGEGDDFTVFEGDDNPEGYHVYASKMWNGPWSSIGFGIGTSSFDLANGIMENARYIKIQDDGEDGSEYAINPGFDLDAIQVLNPSSNPPLAPTIEGLTNGKAGIEYEYSFLTTDPNGDDVNYIIDWGDNSGEEIIGPFPSGEQATAKHSWIEGFYIINVKAEDTFGIQSEWTTLEVSMPRSKYYFDLPLQNFLENYPHLYTLLAKILVLLF
jgi:hypothetical protein